MMEGIYRIYVKEELRSGRLGVNTYDRFGTDPGNAMKRFMAEHDMHGREIINIRRVR